MSDLSARLGGALQRVGGWLAAGGARPGWTENPVFAQGGLERLAGYQGYAAAEPYPHLVLDGLFDPDLLRAVIAEWPAPGGETLETHNDGVYVKAKQGTTWETRFGPATRRFFEVINGPRTLLALEQVTGIFGLLPDPYLFGGGLHMTGVGGRLAVHADFNKHPRFGLDRRLNLLIYLNEGWTEENQGWLELWDRDMQGCRQRILPVFNRTVVFSTTSLSFHGQPEPILGPPGTLRRSIALYYFTNGRPESELAEGRHSTLWQERPGKGY